MFNVILIFFICISFDLEEYFLRNKLKKVPKNAK